jgi:hypothetical protein
MGIISEGVSYESTATEAAIVHRIISSPSFIVKWIEANPMVLPLRRIADTVLSPFARHAARSDRGA